MCRIYSLPLYQLSYRWLRLTMKNKFLLARYRKCNIENWKITIGNHKIDIFMPLHGSRNTIFVRGISSSGRALDLHSRGTGIDTRILQFCKFRQICWKTLQCCKMHLSAFSTRLNPCIRLAFDFGKCRDPGLNQGPSDLQSDALPTELSRLCILSSRFLCHGIDYEKQFKNVSKQLYLASGTVLCTI